MRVLLKERIDGAAGAEVAGFGRSWPSCEDVDLLEAEQALCSRCRDDTPFKVPVGASAPASAPGPVRLQSRDDVRLAGAWCSVPRVPLVAAQRRGRTAGEFQPVLGQQVPLD